MAIGKGYSPRIKGAALAALRESAELLGGGFGPPEQSADTADAWDFPPPHAGLRALRLACAERKKFLGGVYKSVLEADFEVDPELAPSAPLTLRYAGTFAKGAPSFSAPDGAGALRERLNADGKLMDTLAVQDLESMTLEPGPEPGTVRMRLTPIGGSFVWMLFPPVKYAVKLPARHAQAMVDAVARLSHLLAPSPGAGQTTRRIAS
jgi:hypothetical protein